MDERPLGVDEEHIRHPDFLHQAPVEGHALVGGAWEGQPLVLPVVPQIQGHGEVLAEWGRGDRNRISLWIKSHYEDYLLAASDLLKSFGITLPQPVAAGLYGFFMTKHTWSREVLNIC